MPLSDERITALSPRHKLAMATATSFIRETFTPAGILVAGTIIRGEGHTNSDLDFAVVHDKPWRQRVQRFDEGVPVEIFVNPPGQWRKTFMGEVRNGQPSMLGIFSSGISIHDDGGQLSGLVEQARQLLEKGPEISEEHFTNLRYALVTHFEDAVDIEQIDLDRSNAYVVNSLLQAARLRILQSRAWLPREKQLFDRLETLDPDFGHSLRQVFDAPRRQWVRRATPIVEQVADTPRFFAWESEQQSVAF